MLIPNMILKNVIYINLLFFCLHVTKSKQILNIFNLMMCLGAFCEHYAFSAAQRELAKRASILLKLNCCVCVFVCLFGCVFVRIVLKRWSKGGVG